MVLHTKYLLVSTAYIGFMEPYPLNPKSAQNFNFKKYEFSTFKSPTMHSVCLSILHKPLFSNAPGSTEFSQEHLKTITYAKLKGGGGGGT